VPRISEIDDDRGDPTLKPIFDRQRELFGDLLNPTKMLAHCPPILKAAAIMGVAFEQSGQLPKGMLPLIYTRVATINGCPF
jgi:alkylhydroperoxidase family enzyme